MGNEPIAIFKSFPFKENKKKAIFASIVIGIAFLISWMSLGFIWALIALFIMCMPSASFLFPTKYIIFDDRVHVKQLTDLKCHMLKDFDHITHNPEGILLWSTTNRKKKLFIYIFDYDRRERLLEYISKKMEKQFD